MEYQPYPKWVHGQIAEDAEDEARITREWETAHPPKPPAAPSADDRDPAPAQKGSEAA